MNHKKTLLVAALAAPIVLAFTAPRDSVSFAPKDGASVTKTFTSTTNFTMDDMSMLLNGQDPGMMPEMEMEMEFTQTIAVTDTYEKSSDGVPVKLTRTFDEIGTDMEVAVTIDMMGETQEQNTTGTGSSELEGTTVVFSWDADSEEYDKSFVDGEGDDELLEGLVEDMDLRVLLPDGDVSEGDEWDIALGDLPEVLAPGGDLALDIEIEGGESPMGGPDPTMMTNLREMFGDMMEGEATGRYMGTREIDGKKVGVIALKIDIETARDMSDIVGDLMGDQIPEGMEMNIDRMDVEMSMSGEGELHWDLKAGRVHAMKLTTDVEMAMDMEMGMDMGGQQMSMEMSMEMSGTVEQTCATQ